MLVNWLFSYSVLSFIKRNKVIETAQTVDWSTKTRCKTMLLRDKGYSYGEIDENLIKGDISKILKRYKKIQSILLRVWGQLDVLFNT